MNAATISAGEQNPGRWSAGHLPGSSPYRRILSGLMFGGLANFALLYYVQPLLPELSASFGVTPGQASLALSLSTLSLACGLILVGPIADRYGRVVVMRWSLLASGALGLTSAFAQSWEMLLALRAVEGVALAGLPAVAIAYLREEVHEAHHQQANAAYITGTALGGALGRLLPGPLALLGGWQLATGVMGVLTLAAALLIWRILPASSDFRPHAQSIMRAASSTFRAANDIVTAAICIAGFATMGVFVGVYNAVAFRLETPPFTLGNALLLVYLAYLVGIPAPLLLGRISRRIGRARASLVGSLILAMAVALLAFAAVPTIIVGLGLATFAFLGSHSLFSGWIVDRAHRRGSSTASSASSYLLAYYLGSAVVGSLMVEAWHAFGWTGVTVLSAALCAIAASGICIAWGEEKTARRRNLSWPSSRAGAAAGADQPTG